MFRRISETFTATHLTMLAMTAIIVPSALYGAVSYQAVAVTDPNTGSKIWVDAHHAAYVYDYIAGYRNNPANLVEIFVAHGGNICDAGYQYTVPANRALVITSISGHENWGATEPVASGFYLYNNAGCSGSVLASHFSSGSPSAPYNPVTAEFGTGIIVNAGFVVSLRSVNNLGFTFIHGYLVPAGAVPAVGSADAAPQGKPIVADDVSAKLAKMKGR